MPLVQYNAPICPGCRSAQDAGPIADLLRLNTGIAPTQFNVAKRLGFLAGDDAGFPNGRRPLVDVVDIAAAGAVAGSAGGDGLNMARGLAMASIPRPPRSPARSRLWRPLIAGATVSTALVRVNPDAPGSRAASARTKVL